MHRGTGFQNKLWKINLHMSLLYKEHTRVLVHPISAETFLKEFCRRCKDFEKVGHEVQLLNRSFSFDVEKIPDTLQPELF